MCKPSEMHGFSFLGVWGLPRALVLWLQSASTATTSDKAAVFICAESIRALSCEEPPAPSHLADTAHLVCQERREAFNLELFKQTNISFFTHVNCTDKALTSSYIFILLVFPFWEYVHVHTALRPQFRSKHR